jgi:hypothetical protein
MKITILVALLAFIHPVYAATISLENRENYKINLSGLVVYGQADAEVLLHPGLDGNAVNDNQVFNTQTRQVYQFVSQSPVFLFAEHYIQRTENLTLFKHLSHGTSVRMVFGVASKLRDKVFTVIDGSKVKSLPMDNESLFFFEDGKHPDLPGFFIGTGLDTASGEVTGAYTGNVIFLNGFTVSWQPKPGIAGNSRFSRDQSP